VIFHHGTPGSRLGRHPDLSVYAEVGARVISFDRPGYGQSDPLPGRNVAAVAPDVKALADQLALDDFATMGVSGGGPHALACGALLGDRVQRVGVVVGGGPPDDPELDFLDGMAPVNVAEFGAAMESREAVENLLSGYVEQFRADPDAVIDELAAELPVSDQAELRRPEYREVFKRSGIEAIRQGPLGWVDDDLAFVRSWGFALEDVRPKTKLWQGELDVLAPRAHGQHIAKKVPNAEFELLAGEGHMAIDHFRDELAWVLG
jgi:pimeloyl-ACP methyl ester carboxylesterase